jgi:hypothetical protein
MSRTLASALAGAVLGSAVTAAVFLFTRDDDQGRREARIAAEWLACQEPTTVQNTPTSKDCRDIADLREIVPGLWQVRFEGDTYCWQLPRDEEGQPVQGVCRRA